MRESDSLARLGGDEFGLLCPNAASEEALLQVVGRIAAELREPFVLDGLPIELEASIGIAVFPADGTDVETLLRSADVAMYVAKTNRLGHAFYDPATDPHTPAHLALIGELRRALESRELVLHYQPQAELPDGAVRTVEALVRWQHPQRGLLGPIEFVPLAEHTGLIGPLTQYVLDEALGQCRELHDEGIELRVSVNVAARNLLDVTFPRKVERLLDEHRVAGSALTVEITESSVLTDPQRASEVLSELARLGVKVAIDDFGVGYSSLSHLSQLPVDTIKIDKSFVLEMQGNPERAAIVRATIDLAHGLSLSVVAEGVETLELWAQLELLGCDAVQGYYLSRPIPPSELRSWLADSELPTALPAA